VARRRLTRKEIKQPDQFVSYTVQIFDWTKEHTKHLLYGGAGILVLIGLILGWFAWQRHRYQQAEVLLYEAVKLLKADNTAGSEQAVDQADREQAMQRLQTITHDFRGTEVAALAHWHLGHLYFERGDYAAALAAYEQARRVMAHESRRLMVALITLDIGYAQEASGVCDQAITSFEDVVQSSAEWLRGEAFLGMGRCYESKGATDKAMAVYDRALSDAAVSDSVRQRLEERQARLQALGKPASAASQETPKAK
jgi:predicted negative regulator of RcsB-dependent stress response